MQVNFRLKPRSVSMKSVVVLTTLMGFAVNPVKAVTLQTFVNGYYGGNYLSDGTTFLPDTTTVDFGFFYSGGTYTSASTIGASLLALDGNSTALSAFRANNNWVSLGSGQVDGGSGEFALAWNGAAPTSGPGFGTELELNPSVTPSSNAPYASALNGQNLVGKTPFVWIQTPGSAPEFWVGQSIGALPAGGFGNFYSGDVIAGGFTMLYGTALSDEGVTTIPEPSSGALALLGFTIAAMYRRQRQAVNLKI